MTNENSASGHTDSFHLSKAPSHGRGRLIHLSGPAHFHSGRYSQVVIGLGARLLLPSVDHDDGDGHAGDEADGDDPSEDPNNATWGALGERFLCRQVEK